MTDGLRRISTDQLQRKQDGGESRGGESLSCSEAAGEDAEEEREVERRRRRKRASVPFSEGGRERGRAADVGIVPASVSVKHN